MAEIAVAAQHHHEPSTLAVNSDAMEGVETLPETIQSDGTETIAAVATDRATSASSSVSSVSSPAAHASKPPVPVPAPAPAPVPTDISATKPLSTTTSLQSISSTPPAVRPILARRSPQEANSVFVRFPSPGVDHQARVPRFKRDLSLVADVVQQSCAEAVRRVVRDKWEKCIIGSDFHHAFLLNATMHHSNGVIIRRAVRDFGQNLATEAKAEITAHWTQKDIDAISDALLDKCSDSFLDKALERRMKTIDARSLINALARAERLGYESSDILEDNRNGAMPEAQQSAQQSAQQTVQQTAQPMGSMVSTSNFDPSPAGPYVPFQSYRITRPFVPPAPASPPSFGPTFVLKPAPASPPSFGPTQCKSCGRNFTDKAPYDYHVKKNICSQTAKDNKPFIASCEHCGMNFTNKYGAQYHQTNTVCRAHTTAKATPRSQAGTPGEHPQPVQSASSSQSQILGQLPIHSNSFLPPPSQSSSQIYSTPRPSRTEPTSTPGSQDDPYAHLSAVDRLSLEEELYQAELAHAPRFREAEAIPDPDARRAKMESLQNSFSTKQSIIRRRYGVRLRKRRTQQEIDDERVRLGLKHGLTSSPDPASLAAKRQKNNDKTDGHDHDSPTAGRVMQSYTPIPPPTSHLAVSEMSSGLAGSQATAAMSDPTSDPTKVSSKPAQSPPSEAPQNTLSSLQRKGYRISSQVLSSQPEASVTPDNGDRNGSASLPLMLDDSSSDDSDTDGDIPAVLPPRKSS